MLVLVLSAQGNTVLHVARKKYSRSVARKVEEACKEKGINLEQVKNAVSSLPWQ